MGARRPQEFTAATNDLGFRKTHNYTLGQFNPEINYFDLLPQVSWSGAGLQNLPDFGGWDAGRFPRQENDILLYFTDGFSITKSRHLFKFGVYEERDRIQTGSGFGTNPTGTFNFQVDTAWPDDSRHPFANMLLGNFRTYTQSTSRTLPAGVADNIDWYAQDSWKVRKNLTLEIGLRVAYFKQWYGWHGQSTAFAWERYKPGASPLLFRPVRVNNARMGQNPVTGEIVPLALVGQFVPGTGDPANGTLTSKDPDFPKGFMENPGELFQPRFGFAWDVFGNGKTAVRGGASVQNQLLRYEPNAAGPPINYGPTYYYGSFDTLFSTAGCLAPGGATGHDTKRPTPRIYNISFGVQQDLGYNTVVDTKYVSTLGRNLSTNRNANTYPYGTRFLPQNQDPSQTTATPLPDVFLRPNPGWNGITIREASGSSNYHSLQVAANRRFSQGIQFGLAYTYSKAMDYGGTHPMYRRLASLVMECQTSTRRTSLPSTTPISCQALAR